MYQFLNKLGLYTKKDVAKLEEEVKLLKKKLDEKQEVINQTNAYWKKKLYHVKQSIRTGGKG